MCPACSSWVTRQVLVECRSIKYPSIAPSSFGTMPRKNDRLRNCAGGTPIWVLITLQSAVLPA